MKVIILSPLLLNLQETINKVINSVLTHFGLLLKYLQ